MSERRITQIMTETGCRDYIADIVEGGIKIRIIILLAQTYGNLMAGRRSTEDEPVIIALEVGTRMVAVVMKFFHPQTFVTYKSLPRHSG